ncbi:unnamed protein product [Darwinula stevensoni]|uniref:FAD dependent oxidoreductase domain-containing protein n=1 Tax=Darwinula stevensoni TaxID=69355 RepID=A0A7R8X0I3_9CRUS|nr:unnamed protein product [Darwinula stevensoni]CAG0881713.1 unnamed protein product [Darwinula stevensoni]
MASGSGRRICVIGGGVSGLTTALTIKEEMPHARLMVIADKLIKGTASEDPGGFYRPPGVYMGPTPEITTRWCEDSYRVYQKILRSPDRVQAGMTEFPVYQYISSDKFGESPTMRRIFPSFRSMTTEELGLCPGNWIGGNYFVSFSMEMTMFMPYLLERVKALGAEVIEKKVSNFSELLPMGFDLVFNCTGTGAKWLCNDPYVVPVRGQLFKVKAPWIKAAFYKDVDTHIIPNVNELSVGGVRGYESWEEEWNPHDAASIWERATSLVPSLKRATVVRHWVGFRPTRYQVRCEKEVLTYGQQSLKVVHNYGHGAYGVTLAPGCARHAVRLGQQMLQGNINNLPSSNL